MSRLGLNRPLLALFLVLLIVIENVAGEHFRNALGIEIHLRNTLGFEMFDLVVRTRASHDIEIRIELLGHFNNLERLYRINVNHHQLRGRHDMPLNKNHRISSIAADHCVLLAAQFFGKGLVLGYAHKRNVIV